MTETATDFDRITLAFDATIIFAPENLKKIQLIMEHKLVSQINAIPGGGDNRFRVEHDELSRMLQILRQQSEMTARTVDTRLADLLNESRYDRRILSKNQCRTKFLESGGSNLLELTVSDLQLLADGYQVPRIMLDPLISAKSTGIHLTHRITDFVDPSESPNANRFGERAVYSVPKERLTKADDLAIVHLTLQPGTSSDKHRQIGDELAYVLNGKVELRLHDSGLNTSIQKGEFFHFQAEQEHTIVNVGDEDARVLVFRFFQAISSGMWDELKEHLRTNPSPAFVTEVFKGLEPTRERTRKSFEEVEDRLGLARLLRQVNSEQFQPRAGKQTLDQLQKVAAGLEETHGHSKFNRAKIDRILQGLAPIRREDIEPLSLIFGVQPFLFFNYLFPTIRPAIAIRQEDWVEVPRDLVKVDGVTYLVPCRRLAGSDISLAVLFLVPGCRTPVNRHPGIELLVPLDGTIDVHIGNAITSVASQSRGDVFVQFLSSVNHQVANPGPRTAKVLVMRFQQMI